MATLVVNREIKSSNEPSISLNARAIYILLLCAIATLVVLSTIAKVVMLAFPAEQYGAVNELCKRFYLDLENNVPAWFSTIGLFVAAMLLGVIAYCHRQGNKRGYWHWLGMSLIFFCLAIDEATYFHEILIDSLRDKLHLHGILYFGWVIPGFVFVAMVGGAYLPWVWRLPAKVRNGLILAGVFYVGGALGMELIGGMLAESQGFDAPSYILAMTVEETLEMIGIATLIYTLLRYIGTLYPQSLRISIR